MQQLGNDRDVELIRLPAAPREPRIARDCLSDRVGWYTDVMRSPSEGVKYSSEQKSDNENDSCTVLSHKRDMQT